MSDNTITNVVGTPSDPTGGYTLVEEYLEKSYLAEREFATPLVQSSYFSKLNLPRKAGTHVKFTRRQKLRLPEVAKEATDPLSSASLAYEQILGPMEYINDYTAISVMASDMGWIDLAKDFKELTFEAIRRYHNRAVQAAFLGGRYKPGYRNSSGVTVGDATNPHFWNEEETTVSLYGQSFTFQKAKQHFSGGKGAFTDLAVDDFVTMNDFRKVRTRLRNSGAPTIDGKYVAVISDSIKHDLEQSDEYFQAAIRNGMASGKLFDGHIADYAGLHWVIDDEPWKLEHGGTGIPYASDGSCHVCQVFGKDSFGVLRLGGKDAVRPKFKMQDISVTGNNMTLGYLIPSQQMVLNSAWSACLIAPVSEPGDNS